MSWCVVILAIGNVGPSAVATSTRDVEECITASIELGGFNLIEDIAVAGNRAWGVGDQGIVVLEQSNWRVFQPTPGIWLNSIDVRAGDGWVAGQSGGVLRLQGDEWIDVSPPFEASFLDVSVAGPDDAWVVGSVPDDDGTKSIVARSRGGEWQIVDHASGEEATAIFMLSPSLGWIAVADGDGSRLLQWDGEAFHPAIHPPITSDLQSIHGNDADNVWAGGGEFGLVGGAAADLLHFDGERWNQIENDFKFLVRDIHVVSNDVAWAVGSAGAIIRFDGTSWLREFGSGVSTWGFGSIGYFNEDDIWFAGANQVVHLASAEFSFWGADRFGVISQLTSLAAAPDGAIWASGWGGPVLRRGDGGWRQVEGIPNSLWVDRVFIDREGRAWFAYAPPGPKGFLAVPSEVGWTRIEIPTRYPIVDMYFGEDGRIWALASRSSRFEDAPPGSDVLRYESGAWSTIREFRDGDIVQAMDFVDDDSAWFAGNEITKLDGEDWSSFPIPGAPGPAFLVDVSFESPEKGWFVGFKSLITFDAGRWSIKSLGRDADDGWLGAVHATGSGSVLAAGSLGVFRIDKSGVQQIELRTSNPREPHWTDIAVVSSSDRVNAWLSSHYETIGHIEITCEEAPTPTPEPKPDTWLVYLPLIISRY